MHPATVRSSRSSLQSPIISPSTVSNPLHQQQPVFYPIASLQPCGTSPRPSCVYSTSQRNPIPPSIAPLQLQGKGIRWQSKNKINRSQQQYCPQQLQQQPPQLPYSAKPLLVFEQTSSNQLPSPTSSYLVASSTFAHGPFAGDHYNSSGVTLIPQSYFKPPEVQAFCLIQDRIQSSPQLQQQQQSLHSSYYNITASNSCRLQAVNANSAMQLPSFPPYTSVTTYQNQIAGPVQGIQSAQILPSPPINLILSGTPREKRSTAPVAATSSLKYPQNDVSSNTATIPRTEVTNVWPPYFIDVCTSNLFELHSAKEGVNPGATENSVEKTGGNVREDPCSDESSNSFDFTIEAEKMVSALCNTTSPNDFGKEDSEIGKNGVTSLFNGAGDNTTNKNNWFMDFPAEDVKGTSVATQTDDTCTDRTQYPELLRKIIYWGCTEAEVILNSSESEKDAKHVWLLNLSSATRTAVTKSSICFPLYAGDRVFSDDMINALLRISNGWLILDNYLNKQHYPSLNSKLDKCLIKCFELWEEHTYELVKQIVHTFTKLGAEASTSPCRRRFSDILYSSFPGDVSLYTNCDLFDPLTDIRASRPYINVNKTSESIPGGVQHNSPEASTTNPQSSHHYNASQQQHRQLQATYQRETKVRSKWTITENLITTIESAKSLPGVSLGNADAGVHTSSRFRIKGNTLTSPPGRYGHTRQSLNAEFFRLRNKVMESNCNTSRQWSPQEGNHGVFNSRVSQAVAKSTESLFSSETAVSIENDENAYPQRYLSTMASTIDSNVQSNAGSAYFETGRNNINSVATGAESSNSMSTHADGNYTLNISTGDTIYKSSGDKMKLPTVPRNKLTLLSQIEPHTTSDKEPAGMTANLSAWFASMRSANEHHFLPAPGTNSADMRKTGAKGSRATIHQHSIPRNAMDLTRQLQIDANRQLQTLQNMQSIQSAPWNAYNLITNHRPAQQAHDEYDSSEDVRVYMKPGSYNVPKKRHQRRLHRRMENLSASVRTTVGHRNLYQSKEKSSYVLTSTTTTPCMNMSPLCTNISSTTTTTIKIPFPATPVIPPPTFGLENSPRILKRAETLTGQMHHQDIAWKAACASAEILLEALNVKDAAGSIEAEDSNPEKSQQLGGENNDEERVGNIENLNGMQEQNSTVSQKRRLMSPRFGDGGADASSYEASEDDSESTCKLSPKKSLNSSSHSREEKGIKANVKTDSWLIRTLNNANIVSKQKRRKDDTDLASSDSSMSYSVFDDSQQINTTSFASVSTVTEVAVITNQEKDEDVNDYREDASDPVTENDQGVSKQKDRYVGRPTYSETLQRCTTNNAKRDLSKKVKPSGTAGSAFFSTVIPFPNRKCLRKETEKSYHLLHKSRKSLGKKKHQENVDDKSSLKLKTTKDETTKTATTVTTLGITESPITSKMARDKEKDTWNNCSEFLENKNGNKSGDRGWSVWYSSKRRQSLSPLALSKLETIHQIVWQMDEAHIFKHPPANCNNKSESRSSIEDYCKIIKSPMFLETVGYKLKNRIYHKVEHVIRDFRRIVYNSRLYHKNNNNIVQKIEALSKKLEELFEEHFACWDLVQDNITGSSKNGNGKSSGQKMSTENLDDLKECQISPE